MKPAGRERDIEIRILKDIRPHINGECKDPNNIHSIDPEWNLEICSHCVNKSWSTNRNDAWELEKEFIEDGFEYHLWVEKTGEYNYRATILVHKGNSYPFPILRGELQTTPEEAIADCVSQAWLKRKESK
jgi:hypothetical protein